MQHGLTRRAMREALLSMIFEISFWSDEEMEEQIRLYLDEQDILEQDRRDICEKLQKIRNRLTEIDDLLNRTAKSWKTSRMNKVDLSILRLAVYEILFDEDVPEGVAINEAVELAKKYSEEDAPSFINGILATIVREQKSS